jgi:catechol 2,3-dioxygenase-like lactoylglutathione lyase family enzyme
MKLNHINLTVTDVTAAASFLEKYFGMKHQGGNKGMAFLFDDDGLILSLMKAKEVSYPGTFHIGFGQPTEEQVNEINRRLREDGYDVPLPERHHAWTFYVLAPGGFTIEVLC